MQLSEEIVSEFVKATNDTATKKEAPTVYGTIVDQLGTQYVQLDGSDELTPFDTTVEVSEGQRVIVSVKNHTATVTGNITNPSASIVRVDNLQSSIEQTAELIRLEVKDDINNLESSIEQTATAIRQEVSDGDAGLKSQIEQTATQIRQEVSDGDSNLESTITQTASEIRQEISDGDAGVESKITQTASEIRQEISEGDSGLQSQIDQQAGSISTLVKNQNEFSEFQQTVEGFSFMGTGGTVKIQGGDINLTGAIKFSDLSDSDTVQDSIDNAQSTADSASSAASNAQSTANSANTAAANAQSTANSAKTIANSASAAASDAQDAADAASTQIARWTYTGTTYIDGTKLMTGTVTASVLEGGVIAILNEYGTQIGYITVGSSTSSGIQFVSGGNFYLESASCYIGMVDDEIMVNCSYFNPRGVAAYLGYPGMGMWQAVYSYTDTIQTSDENYKHDIETLPDKYVAMLDMIESKRFKMNNGTSDRYHSGFIAQKVKQAMDENGIDSQEFGGWVKDVDADGNEIQMLRYGEFIPILHAKNRQQDAEIAALKSEVVELKALVKSLIDSKET